MPPDANQCPREQYEAFHRQWLIPAAVAEDDSGGRKADEPPHAYRTCFHRDRDRIVHCSAFRRLDFKTQVFVPHVMDHCRTRLTHTLEVAQVARTLGRALRLNEDLIEAVALAHDLGHPPFGHSGEAVLDGLMADHGHFEHNRQSLRVVDYLEHPYPHFRGLNLTRAVRECIALHRSRYDTPICDDFDPRLQPPLEGQLVDLADEIAYTSADLEDSLGAGWITEDQLAGLDLWKWSWETARLDAPDARPIHKRIRACKAALGAMADDAIATTAANLAAAGVQTPDQVRHVGKRIVESSARLAPAVRAMQDFLMTNVYLSPPAAQKERQARSSITDLFNAYVTNPGLLDQRYQRRIESDGLHRVVCDYIAGMTDRFCLQEYEKVKACE
jgi:dGTPase